MNRSILAAAELIALLGPAAQLRAQAYLSAVGGDGGRQLPDRERIGLRPVNRLSWNELSWRVLPPGLRA